MAVTSLLVSYPRTGSHWLRLALGMYLGRELPFVHTHDLELSAEADRVVYLWREDVAAVLYSRIAYEQLPIRPSVVRRLSDEYAQHRAHWLPRSDLVVTYGEMEADLGAVLGRMAALYGLEPANGEVPSPDYLDVAASTPDPRAVVVSERDLYLANQARFRARYARWAT